MSNWTPYALEPYRSGRRTRKSAVVLALLAVLALLWLYTLLNSWDKGSFDVGLGGGNQGTLSLQRPETKPPVATVSIQPGRVSTLITGAESAETDAGGAPAVVGGNPYPMLGWLILAAPFLLLPWLARRLLREKPKELNFGVYKGSMPLEMITARPDLFAPRRGVEGPLFGRTRADYVKDDG